jgi:hypothetical protein
MLLRQISLLVGQSYGNVFPSVLEEQSSAKSNIKYKINYKNIKNINILKTKYKNVKCKT